MAITQNTIPWMPIFRIPAQTIVPAENPAHANTTMLSILRTLVCPKSAISARGISRIPHRYKIYSPA